ncbi:16571_t:CDS:2 [Acaulospora colombiana]|uniref:16571_t:CDS:1 n=1 Tax=Acaulospora colombiana TaxID=27376 RepID=A0ACA9LU39_9GLOM|nr:16571_t:CDS:2 [Acaulospora colombiana]
MTLTDQEISTIATEDNNHECDVEKVNTLVPTSAAQAVLVHSTPMPENAITVVGPDFNKKLSIDKLISSYERIGYQATSVGKAIQRKWRLSDEPISPDESDEYKLPDIRSATKFQHSLVDVIVTTAGGVEEDFIKCLGSTYLGDFHLPGAQLRRNGMNRIGNLLVPNDNYCKFEDWVVPILDKLLEEQRNENNIPVYCPAITDGSLGDMIYFHSFKNQGLVIDLVSDIRSMNNQAVFAKKTGMIILGGGLVKHHICNANLMRNGADYAVYINTGQEFDGSDSGARPDEAVSWGKIRMAAESVKVYCDATIVFPIIVAETFAKDFNDQQK